MAAHRDLAAWAAELERANYAAMRSSVEASPDMDMLWDGDVILTSSQAFPIADANHACLLRQTAAGADALIERIVAHYAALGLPATVYLSPACAPDDLAERLVRHGFVEQEAREAWMVVKHLPSADIPAYRPGVAVREAEAGEALTVAHVFVGSFGLPAEFAPLMARLLAPSIGLPGVHYYLASVGRTGSPTHVGTISWHRHERYAVLGSAGVLPAHRGTPAASNLGAVATRDALNAGVETLILQTQAGTPLERYLRISGFRRAFLRTCYVLA